MKRLAMFFILPLFTFGFMGVGAANADPFPANNLQACTTAGGIYTQTGSGNSGTSTCTVAGGTVEFDTMTAGNSGRAFTLVTTTPTTIYTKAQGPGTTATDGEASSTCTNPGGQEVSTDIPPCQP
jgi:putative hemolysin